MEIKWLTEMELTEEGKKHFKGFYLKNRKAFFVGYTKDRYLEGQHLLPRYIKILLENTTVSSVYAMEFWKVKE
jgi:hypothetical protein